MDTNFTVKKANSLSSSGYCKILQDSLILFKTNATVCG